MMTAPEKLGDAGVSPKNNHAAVRSPTTGTSSDIGATRLAGCRDMRLAHSPRSGDGPEQHRVGQPRDREQPAVAADGGERIESRCGTVEHETHRQERQRGITDIHSTRRRASPGWAEPGSRWVAVSRLPILPNAQPRPPRTVRAMGDGTPPEVCLGGAGLSR